MRRVFVIFTVLAFLAVAAHCLYFRKRENVINKRFVQKNLQNASSEEKLFFSHVLREAFYTSPVGYTLFGDKPLSVIIVASKPTLSSGYYFINLAFPLAQKYENLLQASNFAILIEEEERDSFLYLINKKAFHDTVQQNIEIFRKILGQNITSETLLNSILRKTCTLDVTLKNSSALFGILFGFGVKNALCYDRRDEIDQARIKQGFPPWRDTNSLDGMNDKEVVRSNMERQFFITRLNQKNLLDKVTPSSGFRTLQDELLDLNKKLTFPEGRAEPPGILASVMLPQFCGDPDSEETKELLKKYRIQRKLLNKIVRQEHFLESVVEKFYECCED